MPQYSSRSGPWARCIAHMSLHTSAADECWRAALWASVSPCGLANRVCTRPMREASRFISATNRVWGLSWSLCPSTEKMGPDARRRARPFESRASRALLELVCARGGRSNASPMYSARAAAASFPEGSMRPKSKSRTVKMSPADRPADVPSGEMLPVSGEMSTCSSSRPGSRAAYFSTTCSVIVFVTEAI